MVTVLITVIKRFRSLLEAVEIELHKMKEPIVCSETHIWKKNNQNFHNNLENSGCSNFIIDSLKKKVSYLEMSL